jgi:hypothetical protein
MSLTNEQPRARPIFRWLALGLAAFSFLTAGVLVAAMVSDSLAVEGRPLIVAMCLFAGFMFLSIARTGGRTRRA